jgi:hypothetical protein
MFCIWLGKTGKRDNYASEVWQYEADLGRQDGRQPDPDDIYTSDVVDEGQPYWENGINPGFI